MKTCLVLSALALALGIAVNAGCVASTVPKGMPRKGNAAARMPEAGADWTVPEVGIEFVWIAALNLHVGRYEVTNGEYRKKEGKHDSAEFRGHNLNGDRQPVVYVNFDDAKAYGAWLTARERAAGRLPVGWQYRLPTESEWQSFAQCGDNREYPWGNAMPPKCGNYADGSAKAAFPEWPIIDGYDDGFAVTCMVEESGKNDWGLYGVGGNVWECTSDRSGGFGAWRGASWYASTHDYPRAAYRSALPSLRFMYSGFRLVLSR